MRVPAPSFAHLAHLTDASGLHEHALLTAPRTEHGYCVDDVARALAAACAEPSPGDDVRRLRGQYLEFVLAAQVPDGRFRNRRAPDGRWTDEPSVEDCWGRALWGLGAVVSGSGDALGDRALAAFERGAVHRSAWSRAAAFAGIGAAGVLTQFPAHVGAQALLRDAVRVVGRPSGGGHWLWPEHRLTYANAVVPEVLIAAGSLLGDELALSDGLRLLGWLLEVQTRDGHLSVVPVAGSGPSEVGPVDTGPRFDQQPIEVAALAAACARAFEVTSDRRWADGVELAAQWFLGANDSGTALLDPDSGGGCDGLEAHGRNENQGAESTIALVTTLQVARRLALVSR